MTGVVYRRGGGDGGHPHLVGHFSDGGCVSERGRSLWPVAAVSVVAAHIKIGLKCIFLFLATPPSYLQEVTSPP